MESRHKKTLVVVTLAAIWCVVAWFASRGYYLSRANELVKQETQLSQVRAQDLTDSIKRNLNYLSGIPEYFSHTAQVTEALTRFGSEVKPSELPYEKRKQLWGDAPSLSSLKQSLVQAEKNFQVDIIFVQNAAGDVIAASNWNRPGSSLAQNFSDRDYFKENKEGRRGEQYAVGKTTHIAGLYFSYPVMIKGKFFGSVVVKSDLPKLTFLIKQSDAFVADKLGVIILSHDKEKELLTLADAPINKMSTAQKVNIYQKSNFAELQITRWLDKDFDSLLRIQKEDVPHVLASDVLPDYGLTVFIKGELTQLEELKNERVWIFFAMSSLLTLLSWFAYGGILHIRSVNQSKERLTREKEKFELLMKTSGDGIHLIDLDGKVIDVNNKFCEMLGYSRDELLKMKVLQWDAKFSPEELRLRIAENFGQGAIFETVHRRKDGSLIEVEISAKSVEWEGKIIGWHASRDITERKLLASKLHQSEEEYRHLIEMLPYGVLIHRDEKVLLANWTSAKLFGVENPAKLVGMNPMQFVHPEYQEIVKNRVRNAVERGKDSEIIEEKFVKLDGLVFDAEVVAISVLFENKPASLAVFMDITKRKQNEDELRLAAAVYKTSSEGILITDATNHIVAINPAFTELTGYTADEVIGKSPKIFQSGRQATGFYHDMWQQLNTTGYWQGEIWNRRKNGSIFAEHLTINTEKQEDGSIHRYVALFSDITDQKQKEELIWNQANFDTLTGLPNRRLFLDRLKQEAKKVLRANESLALIFIDLDRFKEINDTLGHAKGDVLLVEAAKRIHECVRETDTIARLGGDEFTVILPDFGEAATLDRIVQNILTELAVSFDLGEGDIGHVSASIGITLYPYDTLNIDELLKHADQAMYAAKAAGRNNFSYFTGSMQKNAEEKVMLTNDLRKALSNNELQVYYQPIVDMKSGQITKAEALLRWNHPKRGLIGPSEFIPLAEDSGLIIEIGEWVFHEAISTVIQWNQMFGRIIQISVNKSPVQFLRAEEHPWIDSLTSSGLPKGSITVEITEGILIKDSARIKDGLRDFRDKGIEVSIDDFGTGFSSLSYLNQFDIDYLKIDQSFVNNLSEYASNKALTRAIIVMAHSLGIKTIAEGVETEIQRNMLIEFGCDYIQGYLYSKPIPTLEFEKLLEI